MATSGSPFPPCVAMETLAGKGEGLVAGGAIAAGTRVCRAAPAALVAFDSSGKCCTFCLSLAPNADGNAAASATANAAANADGDAGHHSGLANHCDACGQLWLCARCAAPDSGCREVHALECGALLELSRSYVT